MGISVITYAQKARRATKKWISGFQPGWRAVEPCFAQEKRSGKNCAVFGGESLFTQMFTPSDLSLGVGRFGFLPPVKDAEHRSVHPPITPEGSPRTRNHPDSLMGVNFWQAAWGRKTLGRAAEIATGSVPPPVWTERTLPSHSSRCSKQPGMFLAAERKELIDSRLFHDPEGCPGELVCHLAIRCARSEP